MQEGVPSPPSDYVRSRSSVNPEERSPAEPEIRSPQGRREVHSQPANNLDLYFALLAPFRGYYTDLFEVRSPKSEGRKKAEF